MPEYLYQFNFQTEGFESKINNQLPVGDVIASIETVFSTVLKIDVPVTSKDDLDEYMAFIGATEIPATEEPTDQVAIAEISRQLADGTVSQQITSTPQKVNLYTTNKRSTAGIITADADNNQFTIDSLFNINTGDNYRVIGSIAVNIPERDFCIFELIHDDNGNPKTAFEIPAYGLSNRNGPTIIPINGTFLVTQALNQSVYLRVYTIGGAETINYFSSDITLERI